MNTYHKIQSLFKRDLKGNMIFGEYSTKELEVLRNIEWTFTEKIDGTNIRVIYEVTESGNSVTFKGKTDAAQMYPGMLERLVEMFPLKKFETLGIDNMCLYGEGYGAKIQKGGGNYIAEGQDFILFDIRVGRWWLKRKDICEIANQLAIDVVPEIGTGTLIDMEEIVKNGLKSQWGDFEAEGIVARPCVQLFDRLGQRIITKLKAKDFK